MKNIQSKTLVKQKNKLRGLIADIKSSAFKKGINKNPSYLFSRGIKYIHLDSRTKLLPHEFKPFLEWVNEQEHTLLPEVSQSNSGYGDLAGVISSGISRCDLEIELLWVAQLLSVNSNKINNFIKISRNLEQLILANEIKQSISILETCDDIYGHSFWSHQLRIALEQLEGGLERQKEYVSTVRNQIKGGLLGFVSYYTSIRNEDKTTISKFKDDIYHRLSKHKKYDSSVKSYLKHRLLNEIQANEDFISDVLFVEQSHHIFDLYETYISVIQKIIQSSSLEKYKKNVSNCLDIISPINDFRIEKIKSKIHHSRPNAPQRSTGVSDSILTGNIKEAIKNWNLLTPQEKVDPWQLIYRGFSKTSHDKKDHSNLKQSPNNISTFVSDLLVASANNVSSALDRVHKIALNYTTFPSMKGLCEFSDNFINRNPDDLFIPNEVGMYSYYYGVEDVTSNQEYLNYFSGKSITSSLWGELFGVDSIVNDIIPSNIFKSFKARGLLLNKRYSDVAETISNIGKSGYKTLWSINLDCLLSSYYLSGDINSLAKILSVEGVKEHPPMPLYSITNYLGGRNWLEFKKVDDPIIACVAIHLLWKKNENQETASLLRFAIRHCLRTFKVKLPSELIKTKRTASLRVWNYFFREVCKNDFIDQLVKGTKELMKERQAICMHMCNIDHEYADIYREEITDLASKLAIDHGKNIIDRTRIHVDSEALKRWANKELFEDYHRYHDLLDVNVKASFDSEFNEIFSDLLDKGGNSNKWRSLDKNSEADMVFISLLARLSDEFLNSPEYGLDFYLSKRIRHQSFIGLIRGPLEFDNLITTKESTGGEYDSNHDLLNKFNKLPPEDIHRIDSELKKFSKRFDDLLENTKNSFFQIESPDKPKGLIKLEINEKVLFLLKMTTHKLENFSDFIDFAVSVFWTLLSYSLDRVRVYINTNLKQNVSSLFDELVQNLKKCSQLNDIELVKLVHNIKTCSIKVQRELDQAALWFSRNDTVESVQSTFDANQLLDIAIDSTLKCHQSFHPKIDKKVINNDDLLLTTPTLVFVYDVMFVALGNICRHSGVEQPNIFITTEITQTTYSIEIKSDFSPSNLKLTMDKLDEIRTLIKGRRFERRTRKEGGSGLLKIAAVALQVPSGHIDFNVTDSTFTLNVTYSIIMTRVPVEVEYAELHNTSH
ncbi:hypothetical protein [Aeromonas caviae]|uniref:hypothetical protein n=1 Tax=Aeromonas caviae TaxID=648 RepID=UPI0029D4A231|nr:hypothetical protein [Aeromonas caviae]MDX7750394.1 hypothetical protein [Aeromonas caviae]MDX7867933.1 hypothetical protein [Aeromonas caviae]